MKWFFALLASVVALALPSVTNASVPYFAKWNCTAPCELGVDYSQMPASEWPLIEAAMAKWNESGAVHLYAQDHGAKIMLEPCVPNSVDHQGNTCGFLTYPKFTKHNGILHSADVQFSAQWFGWDGMPLVYCHELGHTLGINDGAVEPDPNLPPDQTSTSCMAGTGDSPGIEDFALLHQMYG